MLGIFHKACAHPPEELRSPASLQSSNDKLELLKDPLQSFFSSHSDPNTFSMSFGPFASLAYVPSPHHRLFCGYDDIYCVFKGSLNNLSVLIRQYGLHKGANEAMLVIEAYRTLRDRAPYPADQVVKDFEGSFAFIVFDRAAGTVFAALGADGGVGLYWGIGADGSVVMCDDLAVIKAACAKSFAPFPPGCMFHSEGGLMSFEHPMNRMKAMPRIDSEGVMCGATFKVDKYSRINSMPRVGSEVNWTDWISR